MAILKSVKSLTHKKNSKNAIKVQRKHWVCVSTTLGIWLDEGQYRDFENENRKVVLKLKKLWTNGQSFKWNCKKCILKLGFTMQVNLVLNIKQMSVKILSLS